MSNKLFVGNLSFNTTENDLHDAFAAHGTVMEANLTLSFDHRVLDGGAAGRLLARVAALLQAPENL